MADLLTAAEYRAFVGLDPTDTRDDAQIAALLPVASAAVRVFTDRVFEVTTGIASARVFPYDNSGFLDIDDCVTVTTVAMQPANVAPVTLDAMEWQAMPDSAPINYYLEIYTGGYGGGSPEMGFARNMDVWAREHPSAPSKHVSVSVTATWGWPAIPGDVKLAAALIVQGFVESRGAAEGLSAEAIEGWSRSYATRGTGAAPALAIPNRARDLLVAYQRTL